MQDMNYNIRPLQEAVLRIFKVFAMICGRHGLRYYAAYGTALGAVRHHGFIPWDDDLDVAMPREDYNRFVRVVSEELPPDMKFLRGGETFYAPVSCGRLLDVRTGVVDELRAVTKLNLPDPPFVDVFILEGMPEGMRSFRRWQRESRLWRVCQLYRYPHSGCHVSFRKRLAARIVGICLNWRYRKTVDNEDMMRVFDELASQFEGSKYVVEPNFFRMKEERLLEWPLFETARMIPFEDTQMRVAANVEEILRRYYGDYMQLPPEKDRVPTHVLRMMYEGHV